MFITEWKAEARSRIKMVRPDLSDDDIDSYLDSIVKIKLRNPVCKFENNYKNIISTGSLLKIYEWIVTNKPIIAGYGVFFNRSVNNIARMIRKFLESRSKIKDRMKKNLELYGPDSYEYKQDDRLQGAEKVNANACYGAGGSEVSFSYNLYAAASTTATAQSLISTACAAFESFMANNTKFYDFDEILNFVKNVISEEHHLPLKGIKLRSKTEVLEYFTSNSIKNNLEYLNDLLDNLNEEELTRIYYKNNLFEFTKSCEEVKRLLHKILKETKSFRAPEKKLMTKTLENDLQLLWNYYSEFVHYNHPIYNRIFRLKTAERKSVLIIDTDSNMILIKKWIDMIINEYSYMSEENIYTSASIIGVILSNMIQDTLNLYCENANLPKESWKNINMKNEFFYETLITSSVKKNYMGKILLREGKPMNGRLDIKGLSFMKSGISEDIGIYMKDIIIEDIMGKEINFKNVIYRLNALAEEIKRSILMGDSKYTKPASLKEANKYKSPLSQMGIKAVMCYNLIYPENPIILPDFVKIIKVKMLKKDDILVIRELYPEYYEKIITQIFENPEKKISGGITSFAIPQEDRIPSWLIPLVDIDTIVEDNLKSFFPILKSLGFEIINTRATNTVFSNIIKI